MTVQCVFFYKLKDGVLTMYLRIKIYFTEWLQQSYTGQKYGFTNKQFGAIGAWTEAKNTTIVWKAVNESCEHPKKKRGGKKGGEVRGNEGTQAESH